jgi:hypothetical protein
MHVCMYACMRARANQRHTGHHHTLVKHTYDCVFTERNGKRSARMHAHARVHACAHRSSTASQGCASVHYMGECVCCYYFANPSTACLSVCTCTSVCPDACIHNAEVLCMCNKRLMLGQTPVIYTHTYTLSQIHNVHSSTVLCKQKRQTRTLTEAMKARQNYRLAGSTTGCWTNQASLYRGETESWATRCQVHSEKQNKQKRNTYIHTHTRSMHVCMYDPVRSKSESVSHSSPPQLKGARVIPACVRVCADSWRACS